MDLRSGLDLYKSPGQVGRMKYNQLKLTAARL